MAQARAAVDREPPSSRGGLLVHLACGRERQDAHPVARAGGPSATSRVRDLLLLGDGDSDVQDRRFSGGLRHLRPSDHAMSMYAQKRYVNPLARVLFVCTLIAMDVTSSSNRQVRGADLVRGKAKAIRAIAGDTYYVPSATQPSGGYVVDVVAGRCTCPDHETRGGVCKHQWAVRIFRHEVEMPDGTFVVTEGSVRVIYPQQDWSAYNRAQTTEESTVKALLAGLCDGIEQPAQHMGRKRMPLRDVVYGATMKVYGTMSGRRSSTDIRACEDAGLVEHAPAYNTLFKYTEKPELLPLLSRLVDESARPLTAVERNFAADATGFSSQVYARWFDYKHGGERRYQKWVKLHCNTGVLTHVITAAVATEGTQHDSPMLPELVERTAQNFRMVEQSADKGYLSHANLAAIEKVGARPFVPFKSNSGSRGSEAWERMFHYFSLNRDAFLSHYHRRSNVESVFSSMKRKFGGGVRSKTETAQFAEVYLKCICHNLSMVTMAIHELGVEPQFWQPREMQA
jgi:transposase